MPIRRRPFTITKLADFLASKLLSSFSSYSRPKKSGIAPPFFKSPQTALYLFAGTYVKNDKLPIGWTPEIIAHQARQTFPGLSISHEAIYQYVYLEWKEGIAYLPRRHPQRYPKHYRHRRNRAPIPNRLSIDQRPDLVNRRKEVGHWESDGIESHQSRVMVHVIQERVSRFVKLARLENKTAALVN